MYTEIFICRYCRTSILTSYREYSQGGIRCPHCKKVLGKSDIDYIKVKKKDPEQVVGGCSGGGCRSSRMSEGHCEGYVYRDDSHD